MEDKRSLCSETQNTHGGQNDRRNIQITNTSNLLVVKLIIVSPLMAN